MQIRDKVCELNQQKMQCYLILVFMCSVLESSVVCEHACVWGCTYVQRIPEDSHSSVAVNLIFRQDLFMVWSLLIRPDWLTSSQGNLLYVPPPVRVTVSSHHSWVFYVGSGDVCKENTLSTEPSSSPSWRSLCNIIMLIYVYNSNHIWF